MEIKKDRVVLALSTEHAEIVRDALDRCLETQENETLQKISARIEKTLNKQRVLREFEKQGIKPSKDQIKKAMEVAK